MNKTLNTEGTGTSEYQLSLDASWWGVVALVLGVIVISGGTVLEVMDLPGQTAQIVGAIVAVAGALLKSFSTTAYTKSRTEVKIAEAKERQPAASSKPIDINIVEEDTP